MKPKSAPTKRLLFDSKGQSHEVVVFQRLIWGAIAGCLAAFFLAESPVLESLELNMLEWRYKISDRFAALCNQHILSKDIAIVSFDDQQQFDLAIAQFNDFRAQALLAKALTIIERGNPTMIVIDLDLYHTCNPQLTAVLNQYRNIVIALFGNTMDMGSELLNTNLLSSVAAYGYDDFIAESNGLICRIPIDYRSISDTSSLPSLTEAVIDLNRKLKGIGPSSQFFMSSLDHPLYINFRRTHYPTAAFARVLQPGFDSSLFNNRIVLIGSTLTPKQFDTSNKRHTPLQNCRNLNQNEYKANFQGSLQSRNTSNLLIHADSISTLLDNAVIYSFPHNIAHHLLLLVGTLFGALVSVLPLGLRFLYYLSSSIFLALVAQFCFQSLHLVIPVVSPLVVLTLAFVLGTFIHLDTDLRQRNRELAQARESMQVRAEEERQRIAEDLHDETLPALSAVARMADHLVSEMPSKLVPIQMREKLDSAVGEMRRVINDLHPSVLETMGFKPALENLLSILSKETGMAGNFIDGDGKSDYPISSFAKLQLYRIVQEALNNVQKHAQATLVELNVRDINGVLIISVIDNGKGINNRLMRHDSRGLLNIRQRAQLLGAQVEWRIPETLRQGTELQLKMLIE